MPAPSRLPLTRRHLLGGGLLLAGGWAAAWAFGHRPLDTLDSPALGSSARHTLRAAFEALLPDPAHAAACTADVDSFLAAGDPVLAGQLALALHVLEHLGGTGLFTFTRFSRLDVAARQDLLDAWLSSELGVKRQIAAAVRKTVLFTWYERPEAWAACGYPGPLVAG